MKPALLLLNKSHFKQELKALGHPIFCAVPKEELSSSRSDAWSLAGYDYVYESGITIKELLARIAFAPERIIYYDDSQPVFRIKNFHESTLPVAFYSVDSHVHHLWHPRQCGVFDQVFIAQKDFLAAFAEFSSACTWLPLWAPFEITPSPQPSIEVSFRGNLDPIQRKKRLSFLQELSKMVALDYAAGPYEQVYSNSKIVINESVKADLNFRVFEVLMSGAMLLTARIGNGLTELFTPGTHFIEYEDGNVSEAAEKIKYYLAHESERRAIAEAGRAEVLRHHTAASRAQSLSQELSALTLSARSRKYYSLAYQELFQTGEELKSGGAVSAARLEQAAHWLLQSITARELCDFALVQAVVTCTEGLFQLNRIPLALTLTERSSAHYPHETALKLVYIDALTRSGQTDLALEQCRNINADNPAMILHSVSNLLAPLRSSHLFFSLPK